jgi:hypothetical protein
MTMKHVLKAVVAATTATAMLMLAGCATPPPAYDYTAFKAARPVTLLVMPPLNESPDIKATPAMWSHATLPLSEAGYYVLPVTLVDETLRQNGVETAADAHGIAVDKLRDYFGADAAVYITVKRYGTSYAVISSQTLVQAQARIVDLRTGALLWQGFAQASSAEQQQQTQGGLVGLLVAAVVHQIIGTATDAAYNYGGIASNRLLGAPRVNGVLPGPRSPHYGQVAASP